MSAIHTGLSVTDENGISFVDFIMFSLISSKSFVVFHLVSLRSV